MKKPADKARPAKPRPGSKPKARVQYGALPWREETGILEILLVTSRETGRWVIPKGWPMPGKTRQAAAAREAFEEAGVVGDIAKASLGKYDYVKFLKSGQGQPCRVAVFALRVTIQCDRWPEQAERTTRWFAAEDAAAAVQEAGLTEMIRRFGEATAGAGVE